jgi:chromosome segregation protein
LQDDLKEAERARLETESHLGHDRTLLLTLGEELDMLTPEQEVTSAAAEEAAAALEESETTMHGWQEQWDTFNLTAAEPRRQAEVQQSRIQQLETSLERLADRQKRLGEERALLSATRKTRRSWRSASSSPNPKRPWKICRPVKKLRSKA